MVRSPDYKGLIIEFSKLLANHYRYAWPSVVFMEHNSSLLLHLSVFSTIEIYVNDKKKIAFNWLLSNYKTVSKVFLVQHLIFLTPITQLDRTYVAQATDYYSHLSKNNGFLLGLIFGWFFKLLITLNFFIFSWFEFTQIWIRSIHPRYLERISTSFNPIYSPTWQTLIVLISRKCLHFIWTSKFSSVVKYNIYNTV